MMEDDSMLTIPLVTGTPSVIVRDKDGRWGARTDVWAERLKRDSRPMSGYPSKARRSPQNWVRRVASVSWRGRQES